MHIKDNVFFSVWKTPFLESDWEKQKSSYLYWESDRLFLNCWLHYHQCPFERVKETEQHIHTHKEVHTKANNCNGTNVVHLIGAAACWMRVQSPRIMWKTESRCRGDNNKNQITHFLFDVLNTQYMTMNKLTAVHIKSRATIEESA